MSFEFAEWQVQGAFDGSVFGISGHVLVVDKKDIIQKEEAVVNP